MTLTDRDKKLVMIIAPLLLVGLFAFFVVKPKREEAVQAATALEEQRDKRDAALAREQDLESAKATFASDYQTVVRLGKAVPTEVDMPSVLVQLERAAKGTGIEFGRISAGERIPAAGGATGASRSTASGSTAAPSSSPPVAAGGSQAQSTAGQSAEKANNGAATANGATAASSNTSADSGTSGSGATGSGSLPVGGGSASSSGGTPGAGGAAPVAGLDSVPLELRFTGSFFSLADFFHRLKRFVRVANEDLQVSGRLMTVDSFSFSSGQTFPKLEANLKARIYLSPAQQGATSGASPSGPAAGGASSASTADSTPSTTSATAAAPGIAGP